MQMQILQGYQMNFIHIYGSFKKDVVTLVLQLMREMATSYITSPFVMHLHNLISNMVLNKLCSVHKKVSA